MPYVRFTGLLENGRKLSAIEVRGVQQKQQKSIKLPNYVLNDRWQTFKADEGQIIIGAGLAKHWELKRGIVGFADSLVR
ncbi:hypothetical protein PT276_06515 [Orbaceae bacterium ESL0721]|nr:hypothetical protein [Orbaceae bacterium ESL0721]